VGKLAVPDRVLHADGPLDEADRDVLHAHVELGADIVSRMTGLRDAVHAVRHHHERFDGSGYPDGLSGAAIPIDARIVAAADAFSAIRAGRAYQPALPEAETLERLRASAGVSLDPDVVEALLRVTSGRAAPAGRAESRSAAR
jgi:response regulator RpfG family c-di-GMP phosphodiesterase